MSAEHSPKSHEKGHEHHITPEFKEHRERIKVAHERSAETAKSDAAHERELTEARQAAKSEAGHVEMPSSKEEKRQFIPQRTKNDKLHSFNTTMHHVRESLKKPERAFSKVIHQPVVEKVSDVAGKTVARPSGVLGATVAAFIGLLSVYGVAKYVGFPLSGSEMPLLLAIGFAAGLFIEWVYKSLRSVVLPRTQ